MRVNVNLSEELVRQIDEKAKALFVSRSAYITMALAQKMQADDAITMLPDMSRLLQEAMKMAVESKGGMTAINGTEERTGT